MGGGGGQFLDFMGHSCYEGGHRAHGGSPQSPHQGKPSLLVYLVSVAGCHCFDLAGTNEVTFYINARSALFMPHTFCPVIRVVEKQRLFFHVEYT